MNKIKILQLIKSDNREDRRIAATFLSHLDYDETIRYLGDDHVIGVNMYKGESLNLTNLIQAPSIYYKTSKGVYWYFGTYTTVVRSKETIREDYIIEDL